MDSTRTATRRRAGTVFATFVTTLSACGGETGGGLPDAGPADTGLPDAGHPSCVSPSPAFDVGSATGHADPLAVGAGQVRAGRVRGDQLPRAPLGQQLWADGDFVLANEHVAMVVEDAGDSDQYDPWGGRPVGLAHVRGGALVDPSDFGELLLFTFGPSTVVTENVGVVNDGSDGQPAVVRAEGRVHPIPFVYGLIGVYWQGGQFRDEVGRFAIDYQLAPGDEYVDIYLRARHSDPVNPLWAWDGPEAYGFMYSDRLKAFQPNYVGFNSDVRQNPAWLAFVDDDGVGYAFESPGKIMRPLPSASGFVGARTDGHNFPVCSETEGYRHHYGRVFIGGPDADPLLEIIRRSHGEASRTITGRVRDAGGVGRPGVRVHAVQSADETQYVSRAVTDANGDYTLHVPAGMGVNLYAFVLGEALVGPEAVPDGDGTADLTTPAMATLSVGAALDGNGDPIPYKLQVLPGAGTSIPSPRARWGEDMPTSGRLHVEYALAGEDLSLPLPPGTWEVVASRGFRYEIDRQTVTVTAGGAATFSPTLVRSIDTPGTYCADFHIHTARSNDSADDPIEKLRAGLADDLDIPVRSEHEFVEDWDHILTDPVSARGLDSAAFAVGVTSVELTTMERFGHFGVVPTFEDPTKPNGGTPLWQDFPSESDLDRPFRTFEPPELFAAVHARPDDPALIVNHPRGGTNYFGYTGYDYATGMPSRADRYSEDFDGFEVFNDSNWLAVRNSLVRDWFSFLDRGVRMTAVGSSDTHGLSGSPMGYARTCLPLGLAQLPLDATARRALAYSVRDAIREGRATVNGGIFVDATVQSGAGSVAPGGTASGLGGTAMVDIRVRAPMHVDVDAIEVVVDGDSFEIIDVTDAGRCTQTGVVRCELTVSVPVAAANGYVVVAAYGNSTLEPVMRGRVPFGVTNAVYLAR